MELSDQPVERRREFRRTFVRGFRSRHLQEGGRGSGWREWVMRRVEW